MRFIANGPSIPDELITARDDGRVIFFCGAGVSRARANLPDFFGLAEKVVRELGVEADSPAKKIIAEVREIVGVGGLVSADRVFGLLERDFLVGHIAQAVARALQPEPEVDVSAHQIMLDLATGPDNNVRLVTTNFDLLFEKCGRGVPSCQPPNIPDPRRHDHLVGIIHLHGRVSDNYGGAHGDGFILSSAEFGRAYLAEGWATEFVRSVLANYLVVFVGYTADDPPIQYLLEALNRVESTNRRAYAFQAGSSSHASAKWAHKGVEAIGYEDAQNHQALWRTLEAWAGRARNLDAWYESTIALARQGPETLAPHVRGQVAHVVSTSEGARRFAEAQPAAPADWLCVFDPHIRYLKPGRRYSLPDKGPLLNPFAAYGLDSDPVPPDLNPDDGNGKREVPSGVWSCFEATRVDRQNLRDENFAALRGQWSNHVPRLPGRLHQLGVWIAQIAHEPAAVWWAAHQHAVHPDIQSMIRHQLAGC